MAEHSELSLRQELERARAELAMLYEIGNAMRTTLKLDEILYIILTAVTAHAGLGFNRAMLFLTNDAEQMLEGRIGIGPDTGEKAHHIWQQIDTQRTSLDDLISAYYRYKAETESSSQLNNLVQSLKIPLREDVGVLALTALNGMPIEIVTEESRQRATDPVVQLLHLEYFVCVPMKAKDRVVGVIVADNLFTHKPITKDDVRALVMFANQAALAIENSRLYEQTLISAKSDPLTGLWNHGHFQDTLTQQLMLAAQRQEPLCLIMLDLDHFKFYNDTLGHEAGNAALKLVALKLREMCRKQDFVARYGGEEFAIILPQVGKSEGLALAERIRSTVEYQPFRQEGIQPTKCLTVSIGVAAFPDDAKNKDELIHRADQALYATKRSGRNRVTGYTTALAGTDTIHPAATASA